MLIPHPYEQSYEFIANGQLCKAEYYVIRLGTPFYKLDDGKIISGATILKNFDKGLWDECPEVSKK